MSKLFSLGKNDWVKGLAMAILTAVLTLIYQMLQNGAHIDWKSVGITAMLSAIAYILKQLGTDDQGKLGGIV